MSIHSIRFHLVAVGLSAVSLLACGDDEDSKKGDTDAGLDGGLARIDGGPMPLVDGAVPGEVGYPCATASECDETLDCIPHAFPGMAGLYGFCGKSCANNSECGADMVCSSDTGTTDGLYCAELVHEEYGICGPAVGTVCDNRACLYAPNLPVGVCVDLCTLSASAEDAGVEDGGMDDFALCRVGQNCMDVLGSADTGVCGSFVARGAECGISTGSFCNEEDVCAPNDLSDPGAGTSCFQSCADPGVTCAQGSCLNAGGRSFCQ
jgi:hypothetical protein